MANLAHDVIIFCIDYLLTQLRPRVEKPFRTVFYEYFHQSALVCIDFLHLFVFQHLG